MAEGPQVLDVCCGRRKHPGAVGIPHGYLALAQKGQGG